MSTVNSTAAATSGSTALVLDNTLGALYIGILLAMALWGVASLQVFYYFTRFPNDDWRMKILVIVVWTLDSIHQGMITHAGYIYMVTQYGNVSYLSHVEASLEYMILISGITCLVVQSFLVYRVWRLSRGNIPLVASLMVIVVAAFCAITSYFGKSIQGSTFSNIRSREWLGRMSESLVVVSDFSIAGSLIFFLHRSRTGFKKTETMVNRLIIITVNTGLSTSIVASLTLLFISLYPHNYIYVACFVCISKLYANSLLATLNCRRSSNDGNYSETDNSQSIALSGLRSTPRGQVTGPDSVGIGHVISIKVDTETTHEGIQSSGDHKHPYSSEIDLTHTREVMNDLKQSSSFLQV